MLAETMTALAAAGGTAVVQAAGTDAWAGVRQRVARLLSRGDREREHAQLDRLDRTADALDSAGGNEGDQVRLVHAEGWRSRFEMLLEDLDEPARKERPPNCAPGGAGAHRCRQQYSSGGKRLPRACRDPGRRLQPAGQPLRAGGMTAAASGGSGTGGVSGNTFYGATAINVGAGGVQNNYFQLVIDDPVEAAARDLARTVLAQWREEARVRGLFDPVPIPVPWRAVRDPEFGDHPHLTGGSADGSGADLGAFARAFLALRQRRLVVLGEAGAGKTTLAVLLVIELLQMMAPVTPFPSCCRSRPGGPARSICTPGWSTTYSATTRT